MRPVVARLSPGRGAKGARQTNGSMMIDRRLGKAKVDVLRTAGAART
jgi:hypothetical protein